MNGLPGTRLDHWRNFLMPFRHLLESSVLKYRNNKINFMEKLFTFLRLNVMSMLLTELVTYCYSLPLALMRSNITNEHVVNCCFLKERGKKGKGKGKERKRKGKRKEKEREKKGPLGYKSNSLTTNRPRLPPNFYNHLV